MDNFREIMSTLVNDYPASPNPFQQPQTTPSTYDRSAPSPFQQQPTYSQDNPPPVVTPDIEVEDTPPGVVQVLTFNHAAPSPLKRAAPEPHPLLPASKMPTTLGVTIKRLHYNAYSYSIRKPGKNRDIYRCAHRYRHDKCN